MSLATITGRHVAIAHTVCAYLAFLAALFLGLSLHYTKIVENEHYGYPDEWFPSVSATIGDRYPERLVFQILIALTAGPRFLLIGLTYLRAKDRHPWSAKAALIFGVLRTFTCGGWVYITLTDDHQWHDIFMISYIVLTIPWDVFVIGCSEPGRVKKGRTLTCYAFFLTLVPLVYLFIQHKVHKIAGAYLVYALCEWLLIILDVAFDTWSVYDLAPFSVNLESTESPKKKEDLLKTLSQNEKLNENAQDLAAVATLDKLLRKSKAGDGSSWVSLVAHTINALIFWLNLTGFLAMIWHFPLWNMGISGYEALIALVLLTGVLALPFIRRSCALYPQIARVLGTVLGIGAYLEETPEYRLLWNSVGVAFGAISLASETAARQNNAFILGLVAHGVLKYAFCANNPFWAIMHAENGGWNKTGLVLGIAAAFMADYKRKDKKDKTPTEYASSNLFFFTALGLGALLFLLHALATDSGTIITWVWDGYPVRGPLPVPHGAVTIAVIARAAYLSWSMSQKKLRSAPYFVLGAAGLALLIAFPRWIGYTGGLVFLTYVVSTAPLLLEAAGSHNPGLMFPAVFLVYIIFVLASVWIVAYAFVPYGPVLRERTDIVYGLAMLALGSGVLSRGGAEKTKNSENDSSTAKDSTKRNIICCCLVALSVVTALLRFPYLDPKPHHPESKLFTAGIWTVHFGLDNDMWALEDRMRDLMRDLEVDIFGILESDTQRIVMGNRDLTQKIAQDLGYYTDFGPGPNKHTWGCALFLKFPILNLTHHLLPSPVGELAPAIHATLDIYGEFVDIFVFHSGQEEDVEDRRLQTLYLSELMGSTQRPAVLLSYLVVEPGKGNYNVHVLDRSGMHDIDPTDDDRWCEYILFKNLKRVGYARVSRSTITDTEVQVGKFVVGAKGDFYSNVRVDEEYVPEDLRFPDLFKGEGIRGHQYHVFDEPRYFE